MLSFSDIIYKVEKNHRTNPTNDTRFRLSDSNPGNTNFLKFFDQLGDCFQFQLESLLDSERLKP